MFSSKVNFSCPDVGVNGYFDRYIILMHVLFCVLDIMLSFRNLPLLCSIEFPSLFFLPNYSIFIGFLLT